MTVSKSQNQSSSIISVALEDGAQGVTLHWSRKEGEEVKKDNVTIAEKLAKAGGQTGLVGFAENTRPERRHPSGGFCQPG